MDSAAAAASGPDPTVRPVGVAGTDLLVRAHAPGRVNLIGDHTDYTGGWVLPMAIDRGTTIEFRRHGQTVELVSAAEPVAVRLGPGRALPPEDDPARAGWGRYPAGVLAVMADACGGRGVVHSDLPVGAGLSSSSSLTVAFALAAGFTGSALELARLCQRGETLGSGVPGGIMDQLCSAAGVDGAALLIDCTRLEVSAVPVPEGAEVIVAHSGQPRTLVGSAYAQRRRECEAAEALIGPLREASAASAAGVSDPVTRRRAVHVVSENARVLAAAAAMRAGDLDTVGALMDDSHRSLATDFEVSTPALDDLVHRLRGRPGVKGARLTGAGWGGCVVALAEAGASGRLEEGSLPGPAWVVRASAGARAEVLDE
jgi:galactokinase